MTLVLITLVKVTTLAHSLPGNYMSLEPEHNLVAGPHYISPAQRWSSINLHQNHLCFTPIAGPHLEFLIQ